MKTPDLFINVHKGIRHALFTSIAALGREQEGARGLLATALRFIEHHGENEDVVLIAQVRERVPELAARMEQAHEALEARLSALRGALEASDAALFAEANRFLAAYLEHMHEEETVFDEAIRSHFSEAELTAFGKKSVERTGPADQLMMLGWMLPAMPRAQAEQFLARLPADAATKLRASLTSSS